MLKVRSSALSALRKYTFAESECRIQQGTRFLDKWRHLTSFSRQNRH